MPALQPSHQLPTPVHGQLLASGACAERAPIPTLLPAGTATLVAHLIRKGDPEAAELMKGIKLHAGGLLSLLWGSLGGKRRTLTQQACTEGRGHSPRVLLRAWLPPPSKQHAS